MMRDKKHFQNNPFSQFAAGSKTPLTNGFNNGAWLSTKKRGQDDEQIEHDREVALSFRKRQNKTSRKPSQNFSESKNRRKKQSVKSNDSDNSFIVEDDGVEFEDEEEENDYVEDESGDEEASLLLDSESEDKLVGMTNKDSYSGKGSKKKNRIVSLVQSGEDSESSDEIQLPARKKFRKKANNHTLYSEDDDDYVDHFPLATQKKNARKSTRKKFIPDLSPDGDILSNNFKKAKSKNRTRKNVVEELSSDDELGIRIDYSVNQRNPNLKSKKVRHLVDTDSEQEEMDETVALSLAIEESKKSWDAKEKIKLNKLPKKSKNEKYDKNKITHFLNDENETDKEDGDNEEDEEQEEFISREEMEATNVLDAANNLSEYIVKILMSWCDHVPEKIVADGALALSSVDSFANCKNNEEKKDDSFSSQFTSHKHDQGSTWISNVEMQSVCPKIRLKDYQLIGVNWMALLHGLTFDLKKPHDQSRKPSKRNKSSNVNGVLADEMGLGKTVQTIAFLAWLKYRNVPASQRPKLVETICLDSDQSSSDSFQRNYDFQNNHLPHLIIVPASVLSNWEREFNKFCPEMNVIRYHGSLSDRKEIQKQLRQYISADRSQCVDSNLKPLDVVLTTYSYFKSEKSDDRYFLRKFQWNYMVVDEAHCLKNPKNATYRHMDIFDTERRLLLTGTPVQNSPQELMSLLCFLMPLFTKDSNMYDEDSSSNGGMHMLEYFVRAKSGDNIDKKTRSDRKESDNDAYRKLKQLLAPFVLRRTKASVLSQMMPPKIRKVEWVPFDDKNRKIYDSLISKHIKEKKANTLSARKHLFTLLRKAANHPLLLRTRHTDHDDIEYLSTVLYKNGYFGNDSSCNLTLVKKELKNFNDFDIHCAALNLVEENFELKQELSRFILKEKDLFCSPKFILLKTLLPSLIKAGHRMLIFSQWTRCLDLLGCLIETMNLKFLRLDGSTMVSERQSLIDEFTNDKSISVFLLSTRAGGMGINLTAADTCILHDLDFNPMNDLQAEDRCHRIGQTNPVTIIKLVTKETVDADIYQMQERKALMNAAILGSSKPKKTDDTGTKEINNIIEMAVERMKTSDKH